MSREEYFIRVSDFCKIGWIELPAPKLEATVKFYPDIFNWTIEEYSGSYKIFTSETLNGDLNQKGTPVTHGLKTSITVQSIEQTLQRIGAAGSAVIVHGKP